MNSISMRRQFRHPGAGQGPEHLTEPKIRGDEVAFRSMSAPFEWETLKELESYRPHSQE